MQVLKKNCEPISFFLSNSDSWYVISHTVNPLRSNPGQREKINLNFYFRTSFWCPKKSVKMKI